MRIPPLFVWPFAAAMFASAAFSQPVTTTRVTGNFGTVFRDGEKLEGAFECTGTPTCVGTVRMLDKLPECSNTLAEEGAIVFTSMDLSRAGSFQGQVTLSTVDFHVTRSPSGFCTPRPGSAEPKVLPYAATWNGTDGTFTITTPTDAGPAELVPGSFKAEIATVPTIFPMVVSGSIDANVANIRADIQFRPEDVGTTGNIYVFALAPATLVKSAGEKAAHYGWIAKGGAKDTPVQCVLAQLSSTGQLVGVTAANMQAYISGVLSSQGQAVTILNGVQTVNIGGATFYVGYGSSSTAMINGGINRSAVTAPGAVQCKPQPPQTGWWWNPAEDGRGFSIEVRGSHYFFAAFLYDISGRSTWYVATADRGVSLDGSLINGDLLSAKGGQSLGAAYSGGPTIKAEGAITLAFSDANQGTLVWPGGVVPIQRFNIVTNGLTMPAATNQPESGWWWNESESGRGFFMEWQGGVLDIAGYLYDTSGDPVWYLTGFDAAQTNPRSFQGNWWSYGNGQTLTGAWKPNRQLSNTVAPVTIQFSGADTAIMTLPNGRSTALKRHRF